MRQLDYHITAEEAGWAIEPYLKKRHGYSSRTIIKLKHYPEGIRLNGLHARTIDLLRPGDLLSITFLDGEDQLDNFIRSNRRVEIAYEDEDVLVYNKPPAMPCHQSCGHAADTLANVFAAHCDRLGQKLMYRPLNRLDRDTTGAVLIAKTRFAAASITGGFEKLYRALCVGLPQPLRGCIDAPIRRIGPDEQVRVVAPDGQRAVTHYQVLHSWGKYSLVDFRLETGRTHQIRVHMAHLGYPLLGDPVYGQLSPLIGRQALHCAAVAFRHPVSGQRLEVTCPLPEDMRALCGHWEPEPGFHPEKTEGEKKR